MRFFPCLEHFEYFLPNQAIKKRYYGTLQTLSKLAKTMPLNGKNLTGLSFAFCVCTLISINPATGNTTPSLMAAAAKTLTTPTIKHKYLDGRPFNLADRLGKYTIINFWALWCAPCEAEMPALGNLQKELSKYDIEVIAINLGDSVKTIRRFLKTD